MLVLGTLNMVGWGLGWQISVFFYNLKKKKKYSEKNLKMENPTFWPKVQYNLYI